MCVAVSSAPPLIITQCRFLHKYKALGVFEAGVTLLAMPRRPPGNKVYRAAGDKSPLRDSKSDKPDKSGATL